MSRRPFPENQLTTDLAKLHAALTHALDQGYPISSPQARNFQPFLGSSPSTEITTDMNITENRKRLRDQISALQVAVSHIQIQNGELQRELEKQDQPPIPWQELGTLAHGGLAVPITELDMQRLYEDIPPSGPGAPILHLRREDD